MRPAAQRLLQVALSLLAGYIDALAIQSAGGLYVGFMSGNSALLGVAAVGEPSTAVGVAAGLVACFVVGVVLGTLFGGAMDRMRATGVLLLVGAFLGAAALLDRAGFFLGTVLLMALAMGAVNTVFNTPGHVGVGLTYMTGTLVRIGQGLSDALRHGGFGRVLPDLLLWSGLVVGAGLGTLAHRYLAATAIVIAAAGPLPIALAAFWARPRRSAAAREA